MEYTFTYLWEGFEVWERDRYFFECPNFFDNVLFHLIGSNEQQFTMSFKSSERQVLDVKNKVVDFLEFPLIIGHEEMVKVDGIIYRIRLVEDATIFPSVTMNFGIRVGTKRGRLFAYPVEIKTNFRNKKIQKKKNAKKKQHWIPRVYLKGFSRDNNLSINIINENQSAFIKKTTNDNIFWRDYLYDYYGSYQYLENWLAKDIESQYPQIVESALNGEINNLEHLINFISVQSIRHPSIINRWRIEITMNIKQYKEVIDAHKYAELYSGNIKRKVDRSILEYRKKLNERNAVLLFAPENRSFISCDNPVVNCPKVKTDLVNVTKMVGSFYFPISSQVAIIFSEYSEKSLMLLNEEDIDFCNGQIIGNSERFFFGLEEEIKRYNVKPKTLDQQLESLFERHGLRR